MIDLVEELKTIGENMKILEVAEEKALAREEKYQVFSLDGGIVSCLLIGSYRRYTLYSMRYSHWIAETVLSSKWFLWRSIRYSHWTAELFPGFSLVLIGEVIRYSHWTAELFREIDLMI